MMNKNDVTTYLCHKCDRVYYQVSRDKWEANRAKHNSIARGLKDKHLCPWDKRRKA